MTYNIEHLLFGWKSIILNDIRILIRIPASEGLNKQLFFRSGIGYLGVPERFSDYDECYYLEKGPKCKVWSLKTKISELKEDIDYFINKKNPIHQYEIKFELWSENLYDPLKFPEVEKVWKEKRFKDYNDYNNTRQISLL